MVELEGLPARGGEAAGPCPGQDAEQLRRLLREVVLPELDPVFRRMIREEMQSVLLQSDCTHTAFRLPYNQKQASKTIHFQLHFSDELPGTIFTGNTVKSKSNRPLQVFLTDTNKRIITSGSLSSIKIEILVLAGDFGGEEQGSWTEEEFNKNVLCEREGRRPLLAGNRFIMLKDGVGDLSSVSFTDHSKWTRAQRFRLGARVLCNDLVEERVQEAISEAFCVNDQRGEYTMKHHTPLLEAEVWRLKNIRKDGPYHRRLMECGIIKVQDFLKSLSIDPDKLCSILFGKKTTNKKWKEIVQHAQKCDLGHKLYSYIVPGQQVVLVFNSVLQVIGAGFGGCVWRPLDQLSVHQKDTVNSLKYLAYGNQNAMVEINELANGHIEPPSAVPTMYNGESNQSDICCTNHQISHEAAYETNALEDICQSSVPDCIEGSNHVEYHQQASCVEENYRTDGASDGEACSTMGSCHLNEVLDWNTGGNRTEPCRRMFTRQCVSGSGPSGLKVNSKSGTSIRKCRSARRSSGIQRIKWVKLLAAVRIGLFKVFAAARDGDLSNNCQSPTATVIHQHWNSPWSPSVTGLDWNDLWDTPASWP